MLSDTCTHIYIAHGAKSLDLCSPIPAIWYLKGGNKPVVHSCSKVMGFFLRWQNMVFIFKIQTWNFVCGIRRSFAFTMENILSVWYTATPGWTSKFGKVWKTRCQNAATRANIWRCFLVSWDDKYLWVMVSNNRHELYFCSKLLCFSSIHWVFFSNTVSKY